MSRFGLRFGYFAYLLQRYLWHRQRQKKKAARERERQSWEAVRRAAAKAKHNLSYSFPFHPTLVPPTKFLLTRMPVEALLTGSTQREEACQ